MNVSDFMAEWRGGAPYVEARTSGSTGTPKPVRLLKSDMMVSARATNEFFGISAGSVLALPLSPDYIAGKMMAVRACLARCRLLELPVSNTVILDEPVDLLAVVPSQLESLLRQPRSASLIRNLLIGGAPVSDAMSRRIVDAGFNAWLGYGMTETCSHVALRWLGDGDIFTAMPGVSFSTDSRGCLVINSDKYSWSTLVTNDVVTLHSTEKFTWLGRADNVIISGGLKLHPEQLEVMYRHSCPWLPEFFLTGEPDTRWGTRLVMVAVNPVADTLDRLRACISDHKVLPGRVISVDSLPRTENGKLKRSLPQ